MKQTRILLTFWLTLQSFVGFTQASDTARITVTSTSPYQLRTGCELTLLGAGVVSYGASVVLNRAVKPLTQQEVALLNRNSINSFDRGATKNWSRALDRLGDVTLAGNLAITGLVTLGTRTMRQDVKTVTVMFIETLLLANGIERSVKGLTQRIRPFVYNPAAPLDDKLTRDARQSYFSGHATNAFTTAVFTGEVFRHYFPNSRLKPVIWISSLGLASTTAVLRYKAGLHYPTDLLTGAAFGSLVGWGIPKLHELKNRGELGQRLDVQPWSNGSANGIYVRLHVFSR
ncbi:phosphatase PAP2 family protein [Spirosoma taeanense]|uniref:Phosphatase PAP2 family protein n=1 Tax=Spirosoma taeanense TaxID=2735870 RepID=A0A6M5Y8D6_9BACT|nr:phosphatase PAP2 family protein [Spirosoma taeanense]QJW90568.1 phosphatase PAP2 family protein [Spirosoma taeanense]